MTLKEKNERIKDYCDKVKHCAECPLYNKIPDDDDCWDELAWKLDSGPNPKIALNYDILFGKAESVDHPAHYQGKFECIDEMLSLFGIDAVMTFCKLNVYKYRFRANQKNGQEDIEKAEWYMTKLKELEKVTNDY